MEDAAYKRLQSAWISKNMGTTMEEPLVTILPLPLMVFIVGTCLHRLPGNMFLSEFLLLVVPIILNFTFMSHHVSLIPSLTIILIILICLSHKKSKSIKHILRAPIEKRPTWLTNFRGCTSLATVICILAVDLNIFPRKFAKTETFGFSVMDAGVAIYIVCHGLVHKVQRVVGELYGIAGLLAIGFIRLASIKMIGYQEHVTEYGLHWNFFFTLAACRIISSVFSRLFLLRNPALLALASGVLHHSILTSGGQDWVLSGKPRLTLWDANREGLVSIFGYVTLYYVAVYYKTHIVWGSTGSVIAKSVVVTTAFWLATIASTEWLGVSRRLCNIGYITWTFSIALSIIIILMTIDVLLQWTGSSRVPYILHALNRRGLLFFLLGNIFTGAINTVFQTLLLSTAQSYCLIFVYATLVTFVTYIIQKHSEK